MNTEHVPEFGSSQDFVSGNDRYVNHLVEATDDCIAHHPWGAVATALGVGLIFGLLLGGNRKERIEVRPR